MSKLRKFPRSRYWYAEGRDSEGKRFCVSTKQVSRDAAARVARKIELERAVPGLRPLAIAQALAALVEHKRRRKVSAAEIEITTTKGARLLEHFGPGRDVQRLQPADVERYVDARRGDGVSDATTRKEIGKLLEALRLAKRDGLYGGDPARLRPTILRPDVPRDRWLDDAEFLALHAELPAQRRDYLLVWCHTGVRYGELHRIEARHVDGEARRLWVVGTKGRREHRERWVPLSPSAYAVLSARAASTPTGPLFSAWAKPNVRLTVARACRRCGIPPAGPNDFRRTFVSWHVRRGTSELEVQRYVGHSPASQLVRRVYAQLAPESGRAAVASFPGTPGQVSQTVSQTGSALPGQARTTRTLKGLKTA